MATQPARPAGVISNDPGVWDPNSPEAWARVLGMTRVPLFGQRSAAHPPGEHAVLFDGQSASFIISVVNSADVNLDQEPLSWAWSANVQHVLTIDRTREEMFLRRWDSDQIRRFRLPRRGQGARELFALIDEAPGPRAPDIILHLMRASRAIRMLSTQPVDVIHILNGLLLGTEAVRSGKTPESKFRALRLVGDLFTLAKDEGAPFWDPKGATERLLGTRLGDLPQLFLASEILTGCQFEPSLLLRHAASPFYARANAQLAQEGDTISRASNGYETVHSELYDTPENLVRMLTQEALNVYFDTHPENAQLKILDPACGTGTYLVAALREVSTSGFSGSITLRGFDTSPTANAIADFYLHWSASDFARKGLNVELDVRLCNALKVDWDPSNIILMTPPFAGRQRIAPEDIALLEILTSTTWAKFRIMDLAEGFLWKAAKSIANGSVIAAEMPAHFLETQSAAGFREELARSLDLRVVGRFDWTKRLIPRAFTVLQRRPTSLPSARPPVQVVFAKDGAEDAAIRALRLERQGFLATAEHDVEIFSVPQGYFGSESWKPRTRKSFNFFELLKRIALPTVGQLFEMVAAAQTGCDAAFILNADELALLSVKEQAFFRPVAKGRSLRSGRLLRSQYVFYPYDKGGLRVRSEVELKNALPVFWEMRLSKFEAAIKDSKQKKESWWGFHRERTWQRARTPKLISSDFVGPGRFAYDDTGDFVLLQGHGWLWRGQDTPEHEETNSEKFRPPFHESSLPWAYLALLNSAVFDQVLSYFLPSLQGMSRATVAGLNNTFLPDLSDERRILSDTVHALATFGRMIHAGKFDDVDQSELTRASATAYGLPAPY